MHESANRIYLIEDGRLVIKTRHRNFGEYDKLVSAQSLASFKQQDLDFLLYCISRDAKAEQTEQLRSIFGIA